MPRRISVIQRRDRLAGRASTAGYTTWAAMTARQLVLDQQPIGPQVRLQVDEFAPIHGQRDVRIGDDGAMAGKVFGDRRHARLAHARKIGGRQRRHRIGIASETRDRR